MHRLAPHRRLGRGILPVMLAGLLSACLAQEAPGDHRAGLVVLPADGTPVQACVEFQDAEISGETLLTRSGIPFTSDGGNPMGVMICSIGDTGCAFPEQPCWCACQSPGACNYWAYFTLSEPGQWAYSPLGARASRVRPGDVHAWAWISGTAAASADPPAFPETSFSQICDDPDP